MDTKEDSPSDSGSDGPHSPTVAAATAASPPSPPPSSSSSTSNNHGSENASESAGLASSGGGSGAGAGAGAGASVVGAHSLWTQCETANDDQDGESRQPEAPPSSDGASFRSTPSPTTRAENAAAQPPQTVEEALRKGSAFDCPNCRRLVVRRDAAHVLAFTGRCPKQSADTMCACCVRRMVQRGLNAWHPAHPDAQFILDLISDRPGCPVCHSGPPASQEQAAPYTAAEMHQVLVGNRQCCCACCVDARSTPDDSATYRKWWPLCLAADARRHNVSVTPLPGTLVDPRGADTSSGAGAGAGTGAGAAARPSSTTASVAPTTGSTNTNAQLTLLAAADGSAGLHYRDSESVEQLQLQWHPHALLLRQLQEWPHAIVRKCTRCDKLRLIEARFDLVVFLCCMPGAIMCRHCDHMVESPLDDGFAKDAGPILDDHELNVCPVTRGQRLVALPNVAWSTWDNDADVRAKVDTVHKYLQWVKNRMLQPPCPHCGRLLPMTLTNGTFDVVCVCGQNVCLLCQTRLSSLAPDVVAGHAATASMRNLPTLDASSTHFANPTTEWRVRNPANRSCPHTCSELGDYFPQALSSDAPAPGLDDHIMQLQVESLSPGVTAGVYQLSHVRRLNLLAFLLGGHHGTGALPRSLLAAVHAYDVEVHGGALFTFWPEGEFPELPVHDVMYILWKQGRADRCGQFGQPVETTLEEGTDSWTMLPSGPDGPHGDIFFYASDYTGNGSYGVVDVVADSSDPFTDEGAAALAMQIG